MGIGHILLLDQDYKFVKIPVTISLWVSILIRDMEEKNNDWHPERSSPPPHFPLYLQSLWWDKKGNWHKAHELIQDREEKEAAWIHAYLHRKEGDLWNADYWYRRADKKRPDYSLEQEWETLRNHFTDVKR